ncbi:MAG: Rab family GTPase [Anaerolineales bacterium]|jgi:small GTP-binding protein
MTEEKQVLVLKILVAGEGNCGKTSLIRRYCDGEFDSHRAHTIGLEFYSKILDLSAGTIKLSIWDLAGQPQFRTIREEFYKGAKATALVFDLTNPDTLHELPNWYKEIHNAVPDHKFLVVGNKNDLKRVVVEDEPEQFARAIQAPYLETSAKSGHQVEKMFKHLAALAIKQ